MLGRIAGAVRFREPLSFHTSLRIGGPAEFFIMPQDLDDLRYALAFAEQEDLPLIVIGGGNNLLVSDRGLQAVVVKLQGILGREIRSTADENMGRIVDVLVDGSGTVRAAIIDFGGFLGVGSRKIAVAWTALHFVPAAEKRYGIVLELTRDQVKPAPEYKEGKPVLVLVASGKLEPLP